MFVVKLEDDKRSSLQGQEIQFKFRLSRFAFFLLISLIVWILLLQNVEVPDPGLSLELEEITVEICPGVK